MPMEALAVGAEHKARAHKPEQDGADHEVYEVLVEDVGGVLATSETSLTQCETGLHEEHQHCCQ